MPRCGSSPIMWALIIAAGDAFVLVAGPNLATTGYDAAPPIVSPPAVATSTPAPSAPPVVAPAPVPTPAATAHGVVTHLVDGDTLDVTLNGRHTRIRLLNVDAPETVKPDTPVQYMWPRASARLAPLGSTVGLAFYLERLDEYGRRPATAITPLGQNASEVLADKRLARAD